MDRWGMDGRMDGWMDEWMHACVRVWMNGWTDGDLGTSLQDYQNPQRKGETITNSNPLSFIFEPVIPEELEPLRYSLQHDFLLLECY